MVNGMSQQRQEYMRQWHIEHPNYNKEYLRKWRVEYPEKVREYEANPERKERHGNYAREYYHKHREARRQYWNKYRKRNLGKIRKQAREGARRRRKIIRLEIFSLLGNKCSNPNCAVIGGMKDIRTLQIDHVHGGGSGNDRKMRNRRRPSTFYLKILKEIKADSKDYQLLCANCNWIKKYENNEV